MVRRIGSCMVLPVLLLGPPTTASATDRFPPGPPTIGVGTAAPSYQARASRTSVISHSGRYVAFTAYVGELVQVFRRDIYTGTTALVSATRQGRTASRGVVEDALAMSADGRYVAFVSQAANLVTDGGTDTAATRVLVRDMASHNLQVANRDAEGHLLDVAIYKGKLAMSADGRFVAFSSGQIYNSLDRHDVYRYDVANRTLALVSRTPAGAAANADSGEVGLSISGDGRYVAFDSLATDLLSGLTTSSHHVYLRDMTLGRTRLIDVSASGEVDTPTAGPVALSADGRYAVVGRQVRDLRTGTNRPLLVPGEGQPRQLIGDVAISDDGRYVAFAAAYEPYGPDGELSAFYYPSQAYVRDLQTRSVRRISWETDGRPVGLFDGRADVSTVALSGDGRFATYAWSPGYGEQDGFGVYRAGPMR